MVDIEEGNLDQRSKFTITLADYSKFLRESGALKRSDVFKALARYSPTLRNLVSTLEPNEAPPQPVP
jgi:hypothetical protein